MICTAEGHSFDKCSSYEYKDKVLDRLWKGRDDHTIRNIEQKQGLLKLKLVRSPVTRALAAWLTWVGQNSPMNQVENTFHDFVYGNMIKHDNAHWTPQVKQCGRVSQPNYIHLKVEDRDKWADKYVHWMALRHEVAMHGGVKLETKNKCPGYGCSAAGVMEKYYTPKIFEHVVQHFQHDITAYNYQEDTNEWRKIIHQHNLASSQERDFNMSSVQEDLLLLDKDLFE